MKKAKQVSINEDGLLGKVWIGNTNQPICVPGNCAFTIPGRLGKNTRIPRGTPCFIDTAAVNNLQRESLLIDQNNHNFWIWQLLLAAEFFGLNIFHGIMGLNYINRGMI